MAYCLIKKYNIGIAREFQTPREYADAIVQLVDLPKAEYEAMSARAKAAAKQYDYEYLATKMMEILSL